MRVVAGTAKGRRLVAPKGKATRPTSDRVREAIFAMVGSRVDLEGAVVADLFAGSGAMGIEALSRGAAHATFVDDDPDAIRTINANLAATGFAEPNWHRIPAGSGGNPVPVRVVRGDAVRHLREVPRRYDVAFADPPYAWDGWQELFDVLDARLVVGESDRNLQPGERWRVLKVSHYGDTVVTLAEDASPS